MRRQREDWLCFVRRPFSSLVVHVFRVDFSFWHKIVHGLIPFSHAKLFSSRSSFCVELSYLQSLSDNDGSIPPPTPLKGRNTKAGAFTFKTTYNRFFRQTALAAWVSCRQASKCGVSWLQPVARKLFFGPISKQTSCYASVDSCVSEMH